METMEVGFLGTGRMGKVMAANLLKAGHRVRAWDKSPEPLHELKRAGADIATTAADAFRGDAVISMLPNDQALREVFIEGDLLKHGRPSIISVNMGTVSLDCVDALVAAHDAHNIPYRGDGVRSARRGGGRQAQHHGGRRRGSGCPRAAVVRCHGPKDLSRRVRATARQHRQDRRKSDGCLCDRGDRGGGCAAAQISNVRARRARCHHHLAIQRAGLSRLWPRDRPSAICAARLRSRAGHEGRGPCAKGRRAGERAAALRQRAARRFHRCHRQRRCRQGLVSDCARRSAQSRSGRLKRIPTPRGAKPMGSRTMLRRSFIAAGLALLTGIMFGASAAIAAEPIKIGFSMPLTGGLASNGKAILAAYQMWEEDINAQGGLLGRPVKLIYYDDQSNPSLVPAIYAKLFDIDKVDLVFTSYGTNLSVPSMPVVIPRNYVLLGLFALAVNSEFNYPYYFSMFPAGPDAVREFSRGYFEIAKEQKLQTVAIAGADSDFAKKAADGAHDNAT